MPPVARRDFLLAAALAPLAPRTTAGGAPPQPGTQAAAQAAGYSLAWVRKYRTGFDLNTCWDGGDLSRYVYTHMTEFFPHACIHRAGPIKELERGKDPGVGKVEAVLGPNNPAAGPNRTVTLTLDTYLPRMDAFLVLHGGKIVFEKYPQMREFDKHIYWSVSKIIASLLIGMLEDEKRIDVSKPVSKYLPELDDSDWTDIPLIDVLDMASGIGGLEFDDPKAYTDPDSPYGRYEASLGTMPRRPGTPASTHDYVRDLRRLRESGQAFEYTSVNTFVLSWVVERVTRQPYAEVVGERIWRKIGAEADATILLGPTGAPASHGYVSGTLRDLGRLGLAFTPSWRAVCKEPLVSATHLTKIQKGGRRKIFDNAKSVKEVESLFGANDRPRHNTYQWDYVWADGDFFKEGYGGQGLYISPSRDMVVAFFAAGPNPPQDLLKSPVVFARAIAKSGLFPEVKR